MQDQIKTMIEESAKARELSSLLAPQIEKAVDMVAGALKSGKKILIAGNGGSATQASHMAAEFVGRYKIERKALPCIALTTDLAAITSIGNDYGFEKIFERQIQALGEEGDVFIALSTSGHSKNIINAIHAAKKLGINVIGLIGKDGGAQKNTSDVELIVPSNNTARIQEAHLMILHIICELVDNKLFGK